MYTYLYIYIYMYLFVCLFKTQIHVYTYACTYNIYAYPHIVYANVYVFCITCHINFPVLIWHGFNLDRAPRPEHFPSPEILNMILDLPFSLRAKAVPRCFRCVPIVVFSASAAMTVRLS